MDSQLKTANSIAWNPECGKMQEENTLWSRRLKVKSIILTCGPGHGWNTTPSRMELGGLYSHGSKPSTYLMRMLPKCKSRCSKWRRLSATANANAVCTNTESWATGHRGWKASEDKAHSVKIDWGVFQALMWLKYAKITVLLDSASPQWSNSIATHLWVLKYSTMKEKNAHWSKNGSSYLHNDVFKSQSSRIIFALTKAMSYTLPFQMLGREVEDLPGRYIGLNVVLSNRFIATRR